MSNIILEKYRGSIITIMERYRDEVERYCARKGLSVDKVFSADRCCNRVSVSLMYYPPREEGVVYCIDGDPNRAVPLLRINLVDGKLRFEQTEHTYEYLSAKEPTAQAAMA